MVTERERDRGGGEREGWAGRERGERGRDSWGGGGERERERGERGGGGEEKEKGNSNSKTLILKNSSVGCIWTYLTASPTNTNKHNNAANG